MARRQQFALPSSGSYFDSYTAFDCFTGAQTLAQFIQAIEGATGSQVLSVSSNSLNYYYACFSKKSFIFAFSYGLNSQNISAN